MIFHRFTAVILVLAFSFSVLISSTIAHEGPHNEQEVRLTQMKTIITLLEYIKDFIEVHGQTLADRGIMMPQVYVTIPKPKYGYVGEPTITLELEHDGPHFHYTRSDGTTVESPIDSELNDRAGLMNELIILTRLSKERIAEITTGLPE